MSRQQKLFKTRVPPELQPAVDFWLAYKRERHDKPYTDVGFQGLIQRMAEWGPERSMANAVYSASQNWAGLYEEPAKRNGNGGAHRDAPPERYQPWMSDKTIADWPHLDKNSRQCIIENITLGHPTRYR